LRAARSAGIRRFIHVSSTVVYGFRGGKSTPEAAPLRPFRHPYCVTKLEAERELLGSVGGLKVVVLRPSNVYGPADRSFTLPLFRALERGLPAFPAGGKTLTSPCFVLNLAACVKRCLGPLPPDPVYNVSDGCDMPWREFLTLAAGRLGVDPPRRGVPVAPLRAAAVLLESAYRLLGRPDPPPLTSYRVAQVGRDYGFSIERARRELGFEPPYGTDEGIERSVAWYRSGGRFSTP
jgi:nucleoside-diphosphate-sugar epimerase